MVGLKPRRDGRGQIGRVGHGRLGRGALAQRDHVLLAQLEQVLGLLRAAAAVLARRVGAALDRALLGQAALALQEQLHVLAAALLALGGDHPGHYTRLRLRWRTPLWACGVTSFTPSTSRPAAWSERIAVSRPEPGPFTKTSTFCSPCSMPSRAAASAVT